MLRPELGGARGGGLAVEVEDRDTVTAGGEGAGDGPADAGGAAGDEDAGHGFASSWPGRGTCAIRVCAKPPSTTMSWPET